MKRKQGNGISALFEPKATPRAGLLVPVGGEIRQALEQLAATGLFGREVEDVALEMVRAGVRQAIREGWIGKPPKRSKR